MHWKRSSLRSRRSEVCNAQEQEEPSSDCEEGADLRQDISVLSAEEDLKGSSEEYGSVYWIRSAGIGSLPPFKQAGKSTISKMG